jgi:hypothetical protein
MIPRAGTLCYAPGVMLLEVGVVLLAVLGFLALDLYALGCAKL